MSAQLFSGSLRPYPGIPEEWPFAKRMLAESVLAAVRRAVPGQDFIPNPSADIENFWEDAFRLAAAYLASGGDLEMVDGKINWTSEELGRRIGPVSWDEIGGRHARDTLIAHPLVVKHGGRAMSMVTLNSGEGGPAPDTIVDWIVGRHHAGVEQVVVKNAENKSGIWVIPTSDNEAEVRGAIQRELEWASVRLDGLDDALLAQDMIDMQYELRCFVVDGKVITAAGNIEEFTPLDTATGGLLFDQVRLDTRLRQYRGHLTADGPSKATDQTTLAIRLLKFGQRVAAEFNGTVVIDVALNAGTDSPVVVELNELSNSGLFASDPIAVTERLVQAKDRGYRLPTHQVSAVLSPPDGRNPATTGIECTTNVSSLVPPASVPQPHVDGIQNTANRRRIAREYAVLSEQLAIPARGLCLLPADEACWVRRTPRIATGEEPELLAQQAEPCNIYRR